MQASSTTEIKANILFVGDYDKEPDLVYNLLMACDVDENSPLYTRVVRLFTPKNEIASENDYWEVQDLPFKGEGKKIYNDKCYCLSIAESPRSSSRSHSTNFIHEAIADTSLVIFCIPEGRNSEYLLSDLRQFIALVKKTKNQSVKMMILRMPNPEASESILPSNPEFQDFVEKFRQVDLDKTSDDKFIILLDCILDCLIFDYPVYEIENFREPQKTYGQYILSFGHFMGQAFHRLVSSFNV